MLRVTLLVIIGVAFLLNGMAYAGSTTFSNSREVSSKKSDGKTTAAMPDTCLSPPSPPAGPVPVPYPNTSSASDSQKGSKKVKMGGKGMMPKGDKLKRDSPQENLITKCLANSTTFSTNHELLATFLASGKPMICLQGYITTWAMGRKQKIAPRKLWRL